MAETLQSELGSYFIWVHDDPRSESLNDIASKIVGKREQEKIVNILKWNSHSSNEWENSRPYQLNDAWYTNWSL